jgi:DNA-binding transcriptional regulator YiaG
MGAKQRQPRGTRKSERLRCGCGGILRPRNLAEIDVSAFAGIDCPVVLQGVPGLVCDRCGDETLAGEVLSAVLAALALVMTRLPFRLPRSEIRYLRRYLRLTQAELADRMAIHRVTLANWESGQEPISPAGDMVLRGILLSELLSSRPLGLEPVIAEARVALSAVRTAAPDPDARLDPVQIEDLLRRARSSGRRSLR